MNDPNLVLSPEHQRCLENCHSYEKYFWYRSLFEQGKCPLCERPKEIYPLRYKTDHWSVVENTLAEKDHRIATLLIVFNEHVGGLAWNSVYPLGDLCRVYHWIERQYADLISAYGYMDHGRTGDVFHNVDTVVNHYHRTITFPSGTGDVLIPACKGPKRREEIRERALQFAIRYEAETQHVCA